MTVELRPPETVMRLSRMGAAHQTRLSFMRVLLRHLRREKWQFDRPVWNIDDKGVGTAVYRAIGPRRTYSLVAFAHDLPDDMRSDRVIATAWDATFALYDGTPTDADIDRLRKNVPLQEAGRVSDSELSLSRANRSVRLWDHVVERLAAGQQPEREMIESVGYLMRTTAVYGSGKFGAADYKTLAGRDILGGPFRAEMLAVYLIRCFSLDLVEHLAARKGGAEAARIDPDMRRALGIGNSTGLGMAPFLVNHPALLNAWITARETALARVRSIERATTEEIEVFQKYMARACTLVDCWGTSHEAQAKRVAGLQSDLEKLTNHIAEGALNHRHPWDNLYRWASENFSVEAQELVASLVLEPYGDLVDALAENMGADETEYFQIDASRSLGELKSLIEKQYPWAATPDYEAPNHSARFWYVSEAKFEPRLGERYDEPGADREQPLDIGRQAARLTKDLDKWPNELTLKDFLVAHPEHRRIIRRAQLAFGAPYSEIWDNLICSTLSPIDMLRCKLSFFGATRFDPRSDRWVRITMYQNAPFPDELFSMPEDDWVYPEIPDNVGRTAA